MFWKYIVSLFVADLKFTKRLYYKKFYPITTRWMDNDIFGHVNNVNYYSFFDTAINLFLIESGHANLTHKEAAFYVVHSNCNFVSSIAYPDVIEAGLVTKKLGKTSVTYGIGIFKKENDTVSAYGEFVHVCVNKALNKPKVIPKKIRRSIELISN